MGGKIMQFIRWVSGMIAKPFEWLASKGLDLGVWINKTIGIGQQPTGLSISNRPTGIQSGAGNNQNVTVDAPITVTVPSGTNPGMVGERVEQGIKGGIDEIFERTSRATSPVMRY